MFITLEISSNLFKQSGLFQAVGYYLESIDYHIVINTAMYVSNTIGNMLFVVLRMILSTMRMVHLFELVQDILPNQNKLQSRAFCLKFLKYI